MEIQGGGDRSDTIWGELLGAAGTIQLPGDLMIQIVSRLPVKSILRFKSVCRAWYSLFSHPIFIQHHFGIANSFAKMNNLLSFVIRTGKDEGKDDLLSLSLDRSGAEPIFIYPNLPFEGDLDYVEVIGSINGLVCLALTGMATSIVLWNPATRNHSHIINPKLSLGRDESLLCGFAYDHKTDIYKVVRVVFFDCLRETATAMVEIYNTGTNTWRTTRIVGFPFKLDLASSSVEVGGVLYWFSQYVGLTSEKLVVSFDVSSEAFRYHLVPGESPEDKPHPLHWMSSRSWRLEAMGEHLVIMFCDYNDELHKGCICTEKLNARKLIKSDDGGKDSFHIEKFTIEILPDLKRFFRFCRNGKIIAEDLDGKLLVFDREATKYLPRELWGGNHGFYEYTESLVWPSTLA